jgi:hypothetical protein
MYNSFYLLITLLLFFIIFTLILYQSLLSGSKTDETNRKTMKAPGRNNEVIYRDEFTSNPKDYFQDLRKK